MSAKEEFVWQSPPGSDKPLSASEKASLAALNGPPRLDSKPTGKDAQPASAGKSSKTSSVSGHIVGGAVATRGQFPWQAVVSADNAYLCGGSLIAPQWILTAAHCVEGFVYQAFFGPVLNSLYIPVDSIFYSFHHII